MVETEADVVKMVRDMRKKLDSVVNIQTRVNISVADLIVLVILSEAMCKRYLPSGE